MQLLSAQVGNLALPVATPGTDGMSWALLSVGEFFVPLFQQGKLRHGGI